ncbi:MAG: DNA-directed RNA polymerase subunit omega [Oscillospiraceae bacterium]|nr:DNA-directed RNA polymerase subunit omega [Oscillospiraceae bacterium]
MLRPTDIDRIKGNNSRYAVVVGVAKRARDIASNAENNSVVLMDKTVSMAISDFTEGDYMISVPSPDDNP